MSGLAAPAGMLVLCGLAAHAQSRSGQAAPNAPGAGTVTVHAQPVAEVFSAYGQVRPIAPVPVRAIETGIIAQMSVLPGSKLRAGEKFATLTGPEIDSLLTRREGAARSAGAQLAAAERNLAIERQQLLAQLSTQQAVAAAQSAVAAARAARDAAQSELRVAEEMRTLRAPAAGTVLAVDAADGERVLPGQTLLELQTNHGLWLAASYYGADAAAIRVGMAGYFQPASGGVPVPVKVLAISAALAPDGGESVGLGAVGKDGLADRAREPPWLNGERGTVTLKGTTRRVVAVPTRALILDQARWWVLVRTPQGVYPRAVVPGPAHGWETVIVHGLSPGEQIVVQNAYLEYHRRISERYMVPD